MKKIMITIAAILCAAALTTGCGSSAEKKDSSSSQSTATAAPPVTLPEDSEENTENTESTDSTDNADSTDSADDTANAQITPMMWEVTSDEGTKITLMGSMHALKDEVYPLPECIQTAYDRRTSTPRYTRAFRDLSSRAAQTPRLLRHSDRGRSARSWKLSR